MKRKTIGAIAMGLAGMASAQTLIWRKVSPPPASRQEWVAISAQPPGAGWVPDPRNQPGMSIAAARVAADLSRLGADFTQACDRSYRVNRDISGRPSVQSMSGGAPMPGTATTSAPMCCEDAFNNAFPTRSGAGDCRGLDLFSAAGRIMLGPAGFVSTTGGTITIPSFPPIAVPPGTFSAPPTGVTGLNDWHVWRRADRPPSSRNDWYTVSKQQPPGFIQAPEDRPNLTFAEASAIADAAILSSEFPRVCERSWVVWRNERTKKLETASNPTAQTFGTDGWMLIQSNLCCEEAFNLAFPGNFAESDCRRVGLRDGRNILITPQGPVTAMPPPLRRPRGEIVTDVPVTRDGGVRGRMGMPMPRNGNNVPPVARREDPGVVVTPPGPAGSLQLVKTEMLGKDYEDRFMYRRYTSTSVTLYWKSDEGGQCSGAKETTKVTWTFPGPPASLPRGGEVKLIVNGAVDICPDTENRHYWLNYSGGIHGEGLQPPDPPNAYFYRGKKVPVATLTFKVPANAETVRLEYWADNGGGTFVRYWYGKVN